MYSVQTTLWQLLLNFAVVMMVQLLIFVHLHHLASISAPILGSMLKLTVL